MNLIQEAIENAEGGAAVQCVWLKASSPVSWLDPTQCFVSPLPQSSAPESASGQ